MSRSFNGLLESYLLECGFKKSSINEFDGNTRLWHDLGVYGDIAESYIELMRDKYGVDISNFCFDDYFPTDFSGGSTFQIFIFSAIPFLRNRYNKKQPFKPLTLATVEKVLSSKVFEDEIN